MITIENRFFPIRGVLCFVMDGGIIFFSVVASFLILNSWGSIRLLTFTDAAVRGVLITVICQSSMYLLDMYDLKLSQRWVETVLSLCLVIGFVCLGIGLITYLIPGFGVEARMYYLTLLLLTVSLISWRIVFHKFVEWVTPGQNILVVGTGEVAAMVGTEIREWEKFGFRLAGFVGPNPGDSTNTAKIGKLLGEYSQIRDVVRANGISKIVVAIGERRGFYPVKEMLELRVSGYPVLEWHPFFERLSGRIPIENLAPSFFIFNNGFRKPSIILFLRRVLSTVIAFILLLLLSPFLLLVAILIKIDSPGPVIYSQDRVGQRGKIFRIYKFRSMHENAENGIPQWAEKNDPRITRLGRFLRACRIDELPQLFNVIRGDLDLVGPRPERPLFVEKLKTVIPYYSLRHTVKPGITGWAQIMFPYGGTIEESREKLQYDLFYIKNMSLKLDLFILFSTVKIVLLGRGAR